MQTLFLRLRYYRECLRLDAVLPYPPSPPQQHRPRENYFRKGKAFFLKRRNVAFGISQTPTSALTSVESHHVIVDNFQRQQAMVQWLKTGLANRCPIICPTLAMNIKHLITEDVSVCGLSQHGTLGYTKPVSFFNHTWRKRMMLLIMKDWKNSLSLPLSQSVFHFFSSFFLLRGMEGGRGTLSTCVVTAFFRGGQSHNLS